jgi:DNA-binding transcriptional LysR family regulator
MAKPAVRLGAIDLNLLVVFDAVMQERNVTRAARRLGMSQPALSHALGRLRHMLKDELFIPSPAGMTPTPRAEQLAAPLRELLAGFRQALESTPFDPATARTHFHIAVDTYASIVLVRPLAAIVSALAPGILLDFRPSNAREPDELLDGGNFDLALGPFAEHGQRFSRATLLEDEFVAVLHENSAAARSAELTMKLFASIPQIEITSVPYTTDFIDRALARHKLARRVVLRAPTISTMILLLEGNFVCVGRRRAVEVLVPHHPMVIRKLPLASPPMATAMVWPRRLDDQPSHRWLREKLAGVAKGLAAG